MGTLAFAKPSLGFALLRIVGFLDVTFAAVGWDDESFLIGGQRGELIDRFGFLSAHPGFGKGGSRVFLRYVTDSLGAFVDADGDHLLVGNDDYIIIASR